MNVYCNVIHNVFCTFLGVHKITLLQRQSQRSFHISSTSIQRCDNVILLAGYLAWLDPYVKPRATKTNLTVNVESNQTEEEDEVNEGDDNESTVSGISTPSNLSASSAGTALSQVTGRPKYMKKSK